MERGTSASDALIVNGQDYTGKINVPYLANIPNGTATLKFILQNINFTITEKSYDVERGTSASDALIVKGRLSPNKAEEGSA